MSKLTFIGSGKMAEALMQGVLKADLFSPADIVMTDVSAQRLQYLAKTYQVQTNSNNLLALKSSIIILAVKPQNIASVLDELKTLEPNKLIISIVAGVPIKKINPAGVHKVVRAMPNTPALVGAGVTALSFDPRLSAEDKKVAVRIFSAVGAVAEVTEDLINAVTALSGSGPAFVFRLMETLIATAIELGLSPDTAKKLVTQTFIGSARLAQESQDAIEKLVEQVTSPGGTTAAGRDVLEKSEYKQILRNTIIAAKKRADELGK